MKNRKLIGYAVWNFNTGKFLNHDRKTGWSVTPNEFYTEKNCDKVIEGDNLMGKCRAKPVYYTW